ncbi:MAG: hypothetical protein ABSG94_12090 [Brevinematales bacterium]|jgi:hypothetical protein
MAMEIASTPVLTGKEAKKFAQTAKENETKKLPKEEVERSLKIYHEIMTKNPSFKF